VIEIRRGAFFECASLASLDLPEGGSSIIGVRSFEECKSLESFHIPSTVYKMGTGVFLACAGLKHMHIPSSVVSTSNIYIIYIVYYVYEHFIINQPIAYP
jgi:hypothetical protein